MNPPEAIRAVRGMTTIFTAGLVVRNNQSRPVFGGHRPPADECGTINSFHEVGVFPLPQFGPLHYDPIALPTRFSGGQNVE
jgi:hypothetical protein